MPLQTERAYTTIEELIERLQEIAKSNQHKKVIVRDLAPAGSRSFEYLNQAIEITNNHPNYIVLIGH